MDKKSQKVAIIGAGIIGLYLAWKLSQKGYQVSVFEKKSEIGQKVCSGLISERIKNFIPIKDSVIENKIEFCLVHFPKKTVRLKLKPIHFAINRQKLDTALYSLAQKAGAEILLNQPIGEILQGFDKIIGCDGSLSKIRKLLSLPSPSFRLGLQVFLPIEDFSEQVKTWPARNGFFWRIPRGENTEYGAIGQVKAMKEEFEDFCRSQKINFDRYTLKSALIPQGLVLPKTKNITLCGDAMGLTKPWSGGGIVWGLTAAEILLKHFSDFEKYHKEIKKTFNFRILEGRFITSLVYLLGSNFPYLLPSKMIRDNDFPLF